MRDGNWKGSSINDPAVRALFDRAQVLRSDWYRARLEAQQRHDVAEGEKRIRYLEAFLGRANYADVAVRLQIREKLAAMQTAVATARGPNYVESLMGTLGVDPVLVP
jgi:hypothetical protein